MKQIVCEMCGNNDLIKQDGVYVCQYCGTKYTVEEARKMMVESTVDVQGTVKVDNSAFVQKYLTNARRALEKEDWEEVEKYYNMVEQNIPNNIEALFFSSFGKAMLSLIDDNYYKRQQKFEVLNRSMAVISDYYDVTTEDKKEVLEKIAKYIEKMYGYSFIYQPQSANIDGAINAMTGVTGSWKWCVNLFNSTKGAFLTELQQIADKHDDDYVRYLMIFMGNSGKKNTQNSSILTKCEKEMRVFGVLGLIPFTCILGLINLCFIKRARKEHGGKMSENAKYYLKMGLFGFGGWTVFPLLISLIVAVISLFA